VQPTPEQVVDRVLGIARAVGWRQANDVRVLDFGCGEGAYVSILRKRGIRAFGVDVEPGFAGMADELERSGIRDSEQIFRCAERGPYRLPFEDHAFSLIFSHQVMEHVMDYRTVLSELHRLQAPGGVGIHVFPSRGIFLEPHVYVPLGTRVRGPAYLRLWARLGIRNEFQQGKRWDDVARENGEYLASHTQYFSRTDLRKEFENVFDRVEFREDLLVELAGGWRGGLARGSTGKSLLGFVYGAIKQRVVVTFRNAQ